MKTDKLRRLTAASLVLAFTLPQAAQAAAPTVETDESVYINMDYYGAPTNTPNSPISAATQMCTT